MKPVKWGVLGISRHYELRVSNPMADLEDEEIVERTAIASRSKEKAEEAAKRLHFKKAYDSYEKLLQDDEIEAVYIPLPNSLHAEYVKKAADNGKHILCEKPFTMSAGETDEAISYAKKKGVIVMEAFMYKLHPQWRHSYNLIRCGEIGEVQSINIFFGYNNKDPKNIRNRMDVGGGAIPDIGCYAVSSSRFIMGREPERAVSLVKRDADFGTDILSSAILDFGGPRAVFTIGTQVFPQQHVQVFGTAGFLSISVPFNTFPDVPGEISIHTSVGIRKVETDAADMYGIELAEFSFAIRGELEQPIDSEDAVKNQLVLDALFRSEKSNGWEKIGG